MIATQQFTLDHWLVCSSSAFQSITNHWRTEAGAGSLLNWRLDQNVIEETLEKDVPDRIAKLAEDGIVSITIVVDYASAELLGVLEDMSDQSSIHVVEWRNEPLAAVLSMNAPDRALLAALQGNADGQASFGTPRPAIRNFFAYKAALENWETECREQSERDFVEAYPDFAARKVPWLALVAGPANDNDWLPLNVLAAASERKIGEAFRVDEPGRKPARWDLTWAPESGPNVGHGLLRFRVSDMSIPAFVGRHVWVRYEDREIDLGVVDDRGRAVVTLDSPVDIAKLSISIVPAP